VWYSLGVMSNAAWRLEVDDPSDTTFYPISDDMAEDAIQRDITELLRPLLVRFLAERDIKAYVGADQYIYWTRGNNRAVVAPDVYVMPGFPQNVAPKCWKTWQTHVAPSFAVEVMAESDNGKDVEESPRRHDALGTKELVVFDPYVDVSSGRMRFRVHRRDKQGRLVVVEATNTDRVRSEVLGCFVRAVGEGPSLRLRLGTGPEGDEMFPTAEEAERHGRLSAEAEINRMRAEIELLRRSR
jgi:hypothetical protein